MARSGRPGRALLDGITDAFDLSIGTLFRVSASGSGALLADGPRPVRYTRIESDEIWHCTSAGNIPDTDECRSEWILEVLRRRGARPPEDGLRKHRWWRLEPAELRLPVGPPGPFTSGFEWLQIGKIS